MIDEPPDQINSSRRRFVALDRDGTIITERYSHISDPLEVELLPEAARGLHYMNAMGLGLVLITNQSAVGRGILDNGRLEIVHQQLRRLLGDEGVTIDGIYTCRHTPQRDCLCRKPRPGLLELAGKELDLEPAKFFVIGDKPSDIECGQCVGATTILVRTGYGAQTDKDAMATPDYTVDNLWEAAQVIGRILQFEERTPVHEARC